MDDNNQVPALKLLATRNGSGTWVIEFTNQWLPRDVHQFQTAVSRSYRQYRMDLIHGLRKSKSKEKVKTDADKVRERELRVETSEIPPVENREPPSRGGLEKTKGENSVANAQQKFLLRKELENKEKGAMNNG